MMQQNDESKGYRVRTSGSQSRKHSVAGPGGTSFQTSAKSGYSLNGTRQGSPIKSKLLNTQTSSSVGQSASRHFSQGRSGSFSGKEHTKNQARRYTIFGLANPRSGDGLASGFLTDYPPVNEKTIYLDHSRQNIHVQLRFYNVLEASERQNCLRQLEQSLKEGNDGSRKVVCIMGGDGSLATTIKFLRKSLTIDSSLQKGRISFCMLPFGTGNDGAQVFGWGSSPFNELWLQDVGTLMRDIVEAQTESLSLWKCTVDGQVYTASGEPVDNEILMTYYFNMGVDAVVGMAVERNRTRRRCCNYVIYAIKGAYEMIWNAAANKVSNQIKRVVSSRTA